MQVAIAGDIYMPTLTSPGAIAYVNDQSIYAAPNPTTIPLFVLATRTNKTTPDGSGTASGTTEASKLRVVTSQRELLQNYGNPVFVTSAGVAVQGDETGEYGLMAAHSFLGRGSRAYILRADIDLGDMVATKNEPVSPPPDSTYWVKTTTAVGGIFSFDGTSWTAVNWSIYTTAPVNGTDGANGDWAFDYSSSDGIIKYNDNGVWTVASDANLVASFGATSNLHITPTTPVATAGDFWYKTTSSAGGTNLALTKYRAVDGVFVTVPVIRQNTPPTATEGVVWENLSMVNITGARPLYVGTGAAFIPLNLVVQAAEPVTNPTNGTLWYDDTFTDFAMYLEGADVGFGNQWVPVTTTTVSNPSSIQKVISASAPTTPQDGAIWIDISDTANFDNFPVVKRWQSSQWIDITDSVNITDTDPIATAVLNGTYWINTGESLTKNTVKTYDTSYIAYTVKFVGGAYVVMAETDNFWKPAAGTTFGRKAIRAMVVAALQSAIVSNDAARAETNYFQLIATPGYPELYDEMLALNTDNNEVAFVVADTPKFTIPSGIPKGREVTIAEWVTNANAATSTGEQGFSSARSPYAAFYSPWGLGTDLNGLDVMMPPSHMALRTIAYSDSVAAPWFPPAGLSRGRVDNASSVGYLNDTGEYTTVQLTSSMRDIMYEHAINPIMYKPNTGLVVYGQKTFAAAASALDRINVARLVSKMKYDLARLMEPFLFEINDPVTRRSAQVSAERYLAGLKSLRAVYDYAARCDESNNPASVIDSNSMYVDIAIAPAKSIEFIYIPITLLNTGEDSPF
jgi:hypothetical protein